MINPNSDIILLKCPLTLNDSNQITFSNITNQYNYFNNLPKITFENFTYIREESAILVPYELDDIITYNYLMYKNASFSNKWYYAYITNIEYENHTTSKIYFKLDVFQTWQFDIIYKSCFVEREHVNNDTIGLHTIPENLETGEYIVNSVEKDTNLEDLTYLIQVSEWTNDIDNPLATNLGGIPMVGGFYETNNLSTLVSILNSYNSGREEAIINVYVVPKNILNDSNDTLQYSGQSSPTTYTKTIPKQNTLNGYTPKNKKLLTYPYNYMILDNNNGTSNILQYENFSSNDCIFQISAVPTVGSSIKCSPTNYKNQTIAEQEGILCGKFPTLSWAKDEYTNWLTQNAVNIGLGIASSGLTIAGGIGLLASGAGAGAGAGAIVSGGLGIAQTLGQVYEHSIMPNSAKGNINGGDINTCNHTNTFYFIKMSIKEEYAKIIDDYFTMYGYKINSLKIPNITGRNNFNYVKTIGANMVGNIPQNDLLELRNLFNSGITLWHSTSNFLNYSANNDII